MDAQSLAQLAARWVGVALAYSAALWLAALALGVVVLTLAYMAGRVRRLVSIGRGRGQQRQRPRAPATRYAAALTDTRPSHKRPQPRGSRQGHGRFRQRTGAGAEYLEANRHHDPVRQVEAVGDTAEG